MKLRNNVSFIKTSTAKSDRNKEHKYILVNFDIQTYSQVIIVQFKRLQFENNLTNLVHLYKSLFQNINNTVSKVGRNRSLKKKLYNFKMAYMSTKQLSLFDADFQ